jgi:hypothetical protein
VIVTMTPWQVFSDRQLKAVRGAVLTSTRGRDQRQRRVTM